MDKQATKMLNRKKPRHSDSESENDFSEKSVESSNDKDINSFDKKKENSKKKDSKKASNNDDIIVGNDEVTLIVNYL
jgi:hypothetical protein